LPDVSFVSPTPVDNTYQSNTDIYVNISSADTNDHYSFVDFDNDVVLWMRIDDLNSSNDPVDISTYSNNGSILGNPLINKTGGRFGEGIYFDGTGDSVKIPHTDSLYLSNNFSVDFWISINGSSGDDYVISKGSGAFHCFSAGDSGFSVVAEDTTGNIELRGCNTSDIVTVDLPYTYDGFWHNIVMVKNDTHLSGYFDGTFNSSVNLTGEMNSTGDLYLSFFVMTGNVDEVMIFNRTLNPGEVSSLYNASSVQYEHNFTGLSFDTYNFTGYAVDLAGNKNQTAQRGVIVQNNNVSACGNLNIVGETYTMASNITTTGTCFTVTANDITLDGVNHFLDSDGTGFGIDARTVSNFTLQNINVSKFATSVSMASTAGGGSSGDLIVENSTINSADTSGATGSDLGDTNGGNGGVVKILNSNMSLLKINGGNSGGTGNANGGNGGILNITDSLIKNITANGGNGQGSPGNGGNAGTVIFESTFIDLTDDSINLERGTRGTTGNHGQYGSLVLNFSTTFDDSSTDYIATNILSLTVANSTANGGLIKWIDAITANPENFSSFTEIRSNFAFANGTANGGGLNKHANITLYGSPGAGFLKPEIKKDGATCTDCSNFTSLVAATVVFHVPGFRSYNIGEGNLPPTAPTPEINSSSGSDYTNESLNCFDTLIDPDGHQMNLTIKWLNGSTELVNIDYNESFGNNTFVGNLTLDSANTTKNEIWKCSMRVFDGLNYTDWVNSSALTIVNAPPTMPALSTPADGASTTDRTPTFTWSAATDPDSGDTITYDLNLTRVFSTICADTDRLETGISGTTDDLNSDLLCFFDNADFYNWTIRAGDGSNSSNWATPRAINLSSSIVLSLPNSTVEFGNINITIDGNDDTTDDSPTPFGIQNDGNAISNITLQATDLWNSQANPSQYYQFKAANYTFENFSFVEAISILTFTNMPNNSTPTLAIGELNWSNATDIAEVDINITVPPNEVPGIKSSIVTFLGSLAEG
jgi:hypothetical protein